MKYKEALILNIKEKIIKFLQSREYVEFESPDEVFNDNTRRTYYSSVTDKKGHKFFLKIRALDLDFDKASFKKQLIIGKILKENQSISLNKFTPRLIEGNPGEVDYLLYEYIEGENMGERIGYATSKFASSDINEIIQITQALLEFPVNLLPQSFERRGREYYQKFLLYGAREKEIDKSLGIDWDLIDRNIQYFSHGDFKPANFLRTKKGLMVLDFEQASISNMYADVIRLWATIIRDREFKDKLLKNIQGSEKLVHDMKLIHVIFERNYLKFKFPEKKGEFLEFRENEIEKINQTS